MKQYNSRLSNIEMLRILAMIMIIAHHLTYHCFRFQLEDRTMFALGEFFNKSIFYKKLLFHQFFMASGKIGNDIFFLISGYFLINREIDLIKTIRKVLSQLAFTILVLVILSYIYIYIYKS